MAQNEKAAESALEIDRLATQLAKDPHSKVFMPLAEEYGKVNMWQEAAGVLEDGLKLYPGFITAMVALGRAYDHMGQATKAKAILEESVKLSPENLRAHRTLIKIYTSQGLNESALQSCAVILAVNPRDEEALSVQSALRGPLKHNKKSEQPVSVPTVQPSHSVQKETAPPLPVEVKASTTEMTAQSEMRVSAPITPEINPTDPLIAATELIETALHKHDQTGEQLAVREPDPQAAAIVAPLPQSPHAGVVAQLEAWLRTLESRRRTTAHVSRPKTS
jgi:tetratricopeptide (TPR) repeat protein